ncbi:hypothetical protein [Hyalangium versicolor]|uniref:hypothetical protein n=1 Tax=Hyalangium versicolor TaxID=2861190 RepID=UPI001CCE3FDD|nr:hypothetical protein [Hyalangium versicolor]
MAEVCEWCDTPRRPRASIDLELVDAGRLLDHVLPSASPGRRCDWLQSYVTTLGREIYSCCVWCANEYASDARARPEVNHGQ